MKKLTRPEKLNRIGCGKNSPMLIIPYLPKEDCFFDSRHWTYALTSEIFPFSVTTRISANNQQFLKIYESVDSDES